MQPSMVPGRVGILCIGNAGSRIFCAPFSHSTRHPERRRRRRAPPTRAPPPSGAGRRARLKWSRATRLAKPAAKSKGKAAAKKGKPAKPAKTVENSRATRMANKEEKANPTGSTRPNTRVLGKSLRGNFAAQKRGAGATPGIDNRKEVQGLPQRSMVKDFAAWSRRV